MVLFDSTRRGTALATMSHVKVAPEGLKPQECERNLGRSQPTISYIPKKDSIQEAVDSSANMLKLTLPHMVELHIPLWSKVTPEQFLVHIQQALDAISQKGILAAYEKAEKDKEEWTKKLDKATKALDRYTGGDANPPEEKMTEKATEAVAQVNEAIESIANQVFQIYYNLLTEEARRPWNKILGEQID